MDDQNILVNQNYGSDGCKRCKRKRNCLFGIVLVFVLASSFATCMVRLHINKDEKKLRRIFLVRVVFSQSTNR